MIGTIESGIISYIYHQSQAFEHGCFVLELVASRDRYSDIYLLSIETLLPATTCQLTHD